jgi:hypothetical protein
MVGYQTEVILSLMSHARYAVDHTYGVPVAGAIVHGMTEAFVAHTQDRGATHEQCTAFVSLFEARSHEYAHAGKNKLLYDHAYWRGKVLFEKMTGEHKGTRAPMTRLQVAICGAFLTESFLAIHAVLQRYKVAA